MTNLQDYVGFYYFMGMLIEIQQQGDSLLATMPGVPAGYDIDLEPVEAHQFRMHGGPLEGEIATFALNDTHEVAALHAGGFELGRVAAEKISTLDTTERLLAPPLDLLPEKTAAFANLFQNLLDQANGQWIDYQLPYPKYEFIQYVSAQDVVIFHGSNKANIEEFAPRRTSVELYDETGRGNMQAVYGTHDGLWAMFFAVIDRPNLRGSIRNGVMYFHNQAGDRLPVYNFSINRDQLAEKPWRDGTLYLLPRDTFMRLKLTANTYANEWASEKAVKPIARLALQPNDFPFLNQIGGHDDSVLIEMGNLEKEIQAAARKATLQKDRLSLVLPLEMKAQVERYMGIQRAFMPAVEFALRQTASALILEQTSLPPAYRQVLSQNYAELLKSSRSE